MKRGYFAVLIFVLAIIASVICNEDMQISDSDAHPALSAEPEGQVFFYEPFRDGWSSRWVNSTDEKYSGEWHWVNYSEIPGDHGIQMSSPGKLHAIAAPIQGGIRIVDQTLVVQFEMKAVNGLICDGGYMKLLQEDSAKDLAKFDNDARYTIMFGPDRCGSTDKVHFILQHQNPINKKWEEKHAQGVPSSAASDRMTHLYTLVIRGDNSFEILVDMESKKKGSLLEDMEPPINPAKEIDDPKDFKPSDWVDEEMMDDPSASKPEDWDESLPEMIEDADAKKPAGWLDDEKEMIPDPKAQKPDDWDDEEDGEWEAPIVSNPKCQAVGCGEWKRPKIRNPAFKGKWYPPKIKNPAYKGPWSARKIPNPDWFEDLKPHNLHPISAVGFELLSNSGGLVMDNILITSSEEVARSYAMKTWFERNKAEKAKKPGSSGVMDFVKKNMNTAWEFYEDQPAVALALAAIVVVSVVMVVFLCCVGSSSSKSARNAPGIDKKSTVAERKKHDETEADDPAPDDSNPSSGLDSATDAGKPKKKGSRKAD